VYDRLKHNDIVVIYATGIPAGDGTYGKPIIKRVIGLPGDTIRIDTVEGVVYRNSAALPLSELRGTIYEDGHVIADYTRSRFDMPVTDELLVPDNCIFVMGDNRNNSKDSRDRSVGMVDKNYVIGKVLLRVTPFERLGQVT
jgi:signal peptidase I